MTLDEIKALLANKYDPNGRNYTDLASFTNWVAPSGDQVNRDLNGIPQIVSRNPDGSYRLSQFESDDGQNWNISGGMDFANQGAVDQYFRGLDKGDSSFLTDSLKEAAPYALKFAGLVAGGNALLGNGFGFNLPSSGFGADSFAFSDGASLGTAMPNADIAGGGLLGGGSGGFTLDAAMLDPTNPASGLQALTDAGTQAAAGDMAASAGAWESGLSSALPEAKPWYQQAIDAAKNDPLKALKTVQGVSQIGAALTGQGGSGSSYKPGPIDQSIVDKYKNPTALAPIRRQQFQSLALPQGLLDTRLSLLGG